MSSIKSWRSDGFVAFFLVLLLGIFAGPVAGQQSGTITGSVEDSQTGLPVPSVQVFIPDLDIGVLSQANGLYVLEDVPAGAHTLIADRIGYESVTQQVTVNAGATVVLNLDLVEAALQLDELIITGTPGGTQRRALGNVVGTLDMGELQDLAPVVSLDQALNTRNPGVLTVPVSGHPGGGGARLNIRGVSSIALGDQPLIVVDGVRINAEHRPSRRVATGRLNDISPEEIESIEIIKGPAAATLYGTEASAGVVQIITKRGVEGAPQFDMVVATGASWLADPHGKMPINYGTNAAGELLQMNILNAHEARGNEPVFQYGGMQNYSLSVRGGQNIATYYASVNHSDQDGVVDFNYDRRTTGRLNLDITPAEWLTLGVGGSLMGGNTRLPGDIWGYGLRGGPRTAADYGGIESTRNGWAYPTGPERERDWRRDLYDVSRQNANFSAQLDLGRFFLHRMTLGIDRSDEIQTETYFRDPDLRWGGSRGAGRREIDEREFVTKTFDYSASSVFNPTELLGFTTSAGFQYYTKRAWDRSLRGDEFATRALTTVASAARTTASEAIVENTTVGFYIQEQVDWDQRIFVTGAIRFDENSAFGVDYGSQTYPKVSATWVMSEESFWNVDFLNPLRLRGAWGAAGRQPDVLAAARLYEPVPGTDNRPVFAPSSFGNPLLGPERGEELELGFDASLFNGRAQLEFTRYWKTTKDLITDRASLPSQGFPGRRFENVGQVDNWGTEIALDVRLVEGGWMSWDVVTAFATMDNELVTLGGDFDRIPIRRSTYHVQGYPLASLLNYRVLSAELNQDGQPINMMCDGGTGRGGLEFGGPTVPCSEAPRLYWGTTTDRWTMNMMSTWTLFEDWRVYTAIEARGGAMKHQDSVGSRHTAWTNAYGVNLPPLERDPIMMAILALDRGALGYFGGGYVNLDEVGVQWRMPSQLTDRFGVSQASVTAAMRNVGFLWREDEGSYDGNREPPNGKPDPRVTVGSILFAGQQGTQMPLTTSAVLSLRMSF